MLPTVEQPRSQHYGAPGPPSFAFLIVVERVFKRRSFPLARCNLNERFPRRHLPVISASAAARFPKPNGERQKPFGNDVDSEKTGSGRSVEVSPRHFLNIKNGIEVRDHGTNGMLPGRVASQKLVIVGH